MNIARMSEFQAKAGKEAALRDFLRSLLPLIRSAPGCLSCELFQNQADPAKYVIVEMWESVEAHKASVKNIPPELLEQVIPLLDGSPSGQYYHSLAREEA